MKLLEYKGLALRTAAKSDSKHQDLMHAASGLVTEIGEIVDQYKRAIFYKKEYDLTHLLEEVGDVMWYLALALEATGTDLTFTEEKDLGEEAVGSMPLESILAKLVYNAAAVFSCSFTYTNTAEQEAMSGHYGYYLKNILLNIRFFCAKMSIDYEESKVKNIAKLKARYPEGFSEEAAVNRDIEAERKVLEG